MNKLPCNHSWVSYDYNHHRCATCNISKTKLLTIPELEKEIERLLNDVTTLENKIGVLKHGSV